MLNGVLTRRGASLGPRDLFRLTKAAQVGQHLWQFALESRAREPVRDISRRVDRDTVSQQRPLAIGSGFEFPPALVGLEVTTDLVKGDAAVRDEIGAEDIANPRGIPAKV